MFTSIAKVILRLFSKSVLGVLISKMLASASSALINDIFDSENQKKAYEFVKELNENTELTVKEKAKEFNKKMTLWALEVGKDMKESVINCLRELAVNAIKGEIDKCNSDK